MVEQSEDRQQQLMQAGEAEAGFELASRGPQHRHLIGRARRVLEQCGLADPGLTRDDQHATLPHPRAGDQRRDPLLLGFATDQH